MRRNLPFLIFSVLVLALFIYLGTWQVQRLAEKRAYLADVETMIGAAPVPVPAHPDHVKDRFLAIKAHGRLIGPEIHVLVSTRDYGAGYRIIQAFETNGRRLLVDRGYIRLEDKNTPRPPHEITLVGNLYWPHEIDSFTPENDTNANIWYSRDVPTLARALGTEAVMIIARKTTPPDPHILPLPTDTTSIPNRHLEYVFTWYGLALTWMIMSLYFLYRRRAKPEQEDNAV
ncbi:SURF1 family protein [Aquicoccus sp. G2-2]|uniref:SURF1 family protein n=1 Tax=Aquicoccus sp. G2-2 TaxID=3092120 RepID=UPI00366B2808